MNNLLDYMRDLNLSSAHTTYKNTTEKKLILILKYVNYTVPFSYAKNFSVMFCFVKGGI